jgi:hypothetical protein
MLATFCLRLSLGLAACLLLLSPAQVAPRFYRVQFLTVLGLVAVAGVFLFQSATAGLLAILAAAMVLAFLGSLVWTLEGAPLGRTAIVLTVLVLIAILALKDFDLPPSTPRAATPHAWLLIDDLTSAALLGAATSAMLMGHSYLIAPAMALTPLMRLLGALFAALLARMAAAGLLWWTAGQRPFTLEEDALLWLPLRWGLGFVGPLVFGWMAWQSARIRSTQSATGILYVVVIFCFLGELTGQLMHS